jgi:hypothetical protein
MTATTSRGRPSSCGGCGECDRCKRAAYMREWWANLSPARKRQYLDKRPQDRRVGRRSNTRLSEIVRRAHWTVHNAIRDGRLTRQPCEICGAANTDAHHDDYSLPLDVRWLCRKHHGQQHRRYHANGNAPF